jgi:thiosulfate/3-mercaptopyruvate sulfurtransferase
MPGWVLFLRTADFWAAKEIPMSVTLSCLVFSLAALAADTPAARYPRADLLIEARDVVGLAHPRPRHDHRILDARGKGKYKEGHIPGAVWLDHTTWSRAFGDGEDKEAWAKRIGALGIRLNTQVIVYDDSNFKDAARIWWILRYWGVRDVRLLNGGWKAWRNRDMGIEKEDPRIITEKVELKPQANRRATKSLMLEAVKDRNLQIIDARSTEEYCGTEETAKHNGAIPGARHLEWSDAIDPKTQRFKSPEELAKLLKGAGIDVNQPSATYCQSGGRAAVMAFTLELMGGKQVRNYYRSWAEWGNAKDTPIVKPAPPK